MKKIIFLTLCLGVVCAPAHAGWFSKKKTAKPAAEKIISAEAVAKDQDIGESMPVAAQEADVDWTALQNAEEVMDAMVPRFNVNKINSIHPGMSHQEVTDILGDAVLIGYQGIDAKDGSSQSILLKNPYRVEVLGGLGKSYEVFFYMTDVKDSDGKIGDDEVTPVIFEGDELIGKDWRFYNKLTRQLKGPGEDQ